MLPKIILITIIAVIGYFGYTTFFSKIYISQDTVIKGDYNPDKTMVFKNNAILTVEGNAVIKNPVECQNGSVNINVNGNLSISNKLECETLEKTSGKSVDGVGIALAAGGNVEFTDNSSVATTGHVFLVDSPEHFPKTADDLEKLFLETGMDSNDGNFRIGPFGTDEENKTTPPDINQIFKDSKIKPPLKQGFNLINTAYAADPGDVILKGKWKINTPPKGVKRILFFVNFPGRSLEINGEMQGPDGTDAENVKGGCYIDIPELEEDEREALKKDQQKEKKYTGNDALRMRVRSGRLVMGNFKLTLGNGGKGGDAETDECEETAFAAAGTGGLSGNLKFTADNEIIIKDSFTIIPGKGGRGGDAIARGKKGANGNPGKQGGSALAGGGYGADNIKSLKSLGRVVGIDKIYVGSVIGGDGGDAIAIPGDGGDGDVCDAKGGPPGEAVAEGGKGGWADVDLPPGAKDTSDADDRDGEKGKETINEASPGKDGPPCDGSSQSDETLKKVDPSPSVSGSVKKSTGNSSTILGTLSGIVGTTEVTVLPHPGVKLSDFAPLRVEVKVGGKLVWSTVIIKSDCKETAAFPGCNIPGYEYRPGWNGQSIEMKIYDKDGILRASTHKKAATPWKPSCSGSDCPPPFAQPLP